MQAMFSKIRANNEPGDDDDDDDLTA